MAFEGFHGVPYLIHTNRELGLMLRGVKPLAHFMDMHGHEAECLLRYLRMFDRHVALGRFVRRERVRPVPELRDQVYWRRFYALPGEEWRIDAMIALKESGGPWTLECERQEGSLLGYEDWQNEWWIAHLKRRGGRRYAFQPKPGEDLPYAAMS